MSVVLKAVQMQYKDDQGEYHGINSVSDKTTAKQIAAIEAAGQETIAAVEEAGEEVIESLANVQEYVDEWLDDHPEATTTVQDGSLSEAKFTDELKLKTIKDYVTPEMFGAKGDGVVDDTDAIKAAISNGNIISLSARKTYKVSSLISVPHDKCIDGNGATILVSADFTDTTIDASLPSNVVLWFEGIESNDVYSDMSLFINNFTVDCRQNTNVIGIYIGSKTLFDAGFVSTISKAFKNHQVSNVTVISGDTGLYIAEAWNNQFSHLMVEGAINEVVAIKGQSVNNYFSDCSFNGANHSEHSLYINVSDNYDKRPEGNVFANSFIGYSKVGIYIVTALSMYFNNCIIDLMQKQSIKADISDDCKFSNCYIFGGDAETPTISLNDNTTESTLNKCIFIGCYVAHRNSYMSVDIGAKRYGDRFVSCDLKGSIDSDSDSLVSRINTSFLAGSFLGAGKENHIANTNVSNGSLTEHFETTTCYSSSSDIMNASSILAINNAYAKLNNGVCFVLYANCSGILYEITGVKISDTIGSMTAKPCNPSSNDLTYYRRLISGTWGSWYCLEGFYANGSLASILADLGAYLIIATHSTDATQYCVGIAYKLTASAEVTFINISNSGIHFTAGNTGGTALITDASNSYDNVRVKAIKIQ